jgi:NAD(P)-dependent dehydrogenase (short-subunit alcohol dehydrogenase family)
MTLAGKVALVTGSSRGIVLRLAQEGADVVINSVHEDLPFPNFTADCVSKGGLKMLTRNLAVELAVELGRLGITIIALARKLRAC